MWLVTTFGFFSIIGKIGDDALTVSAQTRQDLQELRQRHLPELQATTEDSVSDYKYNAPAPPHAVARAMSQIAMEIDYHSFRNLILKEQGFQRAMVHARVRSILRDLQEEEQWSDPKFANQKLKEQ